MEFRKRSAQAQLFRVACIYARNERSDKPVEQFIAEFPAHKRSDGFIGNGWMSAVENLGEKPPLRARAEQRRCQQGWRRKRSRDQLPAHEDVSLARESARSS